MKITASIRGQIQGIIWMPAAICLKSFKISEDDFRYSDGSRPSLRDMVLRATNDGDFRSANIFWGELILEAEIPNKTTRITKKRSFDLRKFRSIQDCIVPEEEVVLEDWED